MGEIIGHRFFLKKNKSSTKKLTSFTLTIQIFKVAIQFKDCIDIFFYNCNINMNGGNKYFSNSYGLRVE